MDNSLLISQLKSENVSQKAEQDKSRQEVEKYKKLSIDYEVYLRKIEEELKSERQEKNDGGPGGGAGGGVGGGAGGRL